MAIQKLFDDFEGVLKLWEELGKPGEEVLLWN